MLAISEDQVIERIRADNPWWDSPHQIGARIGRMRPRAYFDLLFRLIEQTLPKRALILMGPRRVGKTVMLYQAIETLIRNGVSPTSLCYINVELPLYNGLGIEQFVRLAWKASGADTNGPFFFFFDEIQYLRQWEVHLKTAVDAYDQIKFVVSGSAAAALRLKSNESGAGRFTDFTLPPLTFYEYLDLLGKLDLVKIEDSEEEGVDKISDRSRKRQFSAPDIDALNEQFLGYLNFGGYPEVIFSREIQADPGRYIRNDIIDKVLLRDLPSLYGIQDIQELNSLFTSLAYNTGNEVSLEGLSQHSGVAKNTIKRYIEYLEAAFLIKIVHRVDRGAKTFKRANFFKVYLTNPSMRSALFAPLKPDDEAMGNLVETAVFSQSFHSPNTNLHYARWNDGEVDIVSIQNMKPNWVVEVKWSDAYEEDPRKLKSLLQFCANHGDCAAAVTSRTKSSVKEINGITIDFRPASLYCFLLGYNLIRGVTSDRQAPCLPGPYRAV